MCARVHSAYKTSILWKTIALEWKQGSGLCSFNDAALAVISQSTWYTISTPEVSFADKPSKNYEGSPRYIDSNTVKKQPFLHMHRKQVAPTISSGPWNYKMKYMMYIVPCSIFYPTQLIVSDVL